MSFPRLISPIRRAGLMVVAGLAVAGFAVAQSAPSPAPSIDQFTHSPFSTGYSSSQDGLGHAGLSSSGLQMAEFSLPGNPASGGAAAFGGGGQYGQGGDSGGGHHGVFHHPLAFEAGGGFNAPIGNDTPFITWGGNFTVGAGFHFTRVFSTLVEYQFIDDKLPGAFISAESSAGATSGDAHISAITGSPVINLFPKKTNGAYLVGGFGYYHKSTNFGAFECCDIYGDEVNVTIGSFTSNQWGGNAGFGIYHRLGGDLYGPDTAGTSELFAEARYTFIHTPPVTQPNGLGTTELIPVTVGVRF
ncbi:MAG: hypothetical protein ABSH31_22190 [Bryobacteraceae bacterium]|jgi:hypothetical protein